MRITAWMQMGCERREVRFDVGHGALISHGDGCVQAGMDRLVLDWMSCRAGWGWHVEGRPDLESDAGDAEDSDICKYVVVGDVMNPGTERSLVRPRSEAAFRGRLDRSFGEV